VEIETTYIIDYLENRLSEKDKESFEKLLKSSAELTKEVNDIRFIWETSSELKLHKKIDTLRNWNELSRSIRFLKFKSKLFHFTQTAAAILFIPVILTAFFLYQTLKEHENRPTEQIELTSAYGFISKVTLPDKSEVWLNSGSKISYPQQFSAGKRQVSLVGEAYFKVQSDQKNRFEVLVNNDIIVNAYGTEFNIYAYDEEDLIEATLVSGNIEVLSSNLKNSRILSPGQQVIYNKGNGSMQVKEINLTVKTAWKDGKMIFRRANMTEITRRLARHFNVDILLEGEELYGYEYSATFTTETLQEILQLLEKSAPITCKIIEPEQSDDYTYSKRTVIISMQKKR